MLKSRSEMKSNSCLTAGLVLVDSSPEAPAGIDRGPTAGP